MAAGSFPPVSPVVASGVVTCSDVAGPDVDPCVVDGAASVAVAEVLPGNVVLPCVLPMACTLDPLLKRSASTVAVAKSVVF